MARPHTHQAPPVTSRGLKNSYLLAYNFFSAMLWFSVLGRVLVIGSKDGIESGKVYEGTERFARLVQTGAVLEVVHSLVGMYILQYLWWMEVIIGRGLCMGSWADGVLGGYMDASLDCRDEDVCANGLIVGIVRAPLLTTLMQVASRLLLVWGVGYNFPQTTRNSPAYSGMLFAWSVTEVIRYSYFVFVLSGLGVPRLWTWLRYALFSPFEAVCAGLLTKACFRYNTFLVLYPLGVASETWLIFKAIGPAEKMRKEYGVVLWAILATYVPGFYMLFTYMLGQRRKIMRSKAV